MSPLRWRGRSGHETRMRSLRQPVRRDLGRAVAITPHRRRRTNARRRKRSPRPGCRDDRIRDGAIVRRRRAWLALLGDCASPRVAPASRGRRLLSAPVVAAERIPASDPLRPAVRTERVARSVGRDSRRGTKGGLRIDHPRQLFWIHPTMEAFADELPSLVCSSLASTMAPELTRSLSREGRRAVRRRNGTT
jgi:hypothetical protein